MVRPAAVLVVAAFLSATVAALGQPQTKPAAPAPQTTAPKPAAKPAPKPAAKPAAKPEAKAEPAAAPAATVATAPVVAPKPAPATDVRIKTAYTQGAQVSQNTTYIQGPRQRLEFPGVVMLDQCDLKRSVVLNTSAKRYRVQPYPETAGVQAPTPAAPSPAPPQARGGVVTLTTSLSDTLERQTLLGLEARRIKSVVTKQFSGTACDKSPLKVEVDAWYVDLPMPSSCALSARQVAPPPPPDPNACMDRIETRVVGDAKLGFPVKTVTTTTLGEGDKLEVSTSSQDVTELEITRLDRALFDVPADFVEANSGAEIVPALATGGSLSEALFGSTVDGSSLAAPKKPGVIRIGVLEPINKTTRTLSTSSLRQELATKFRKAPYEAIPVAGSSASAIEEEAARLQCDYLMLAEIVEAKTSKPSKLGGVMKMAGGAPATDSHDVKLDYKLFAVGATQSPKLSGNAKASSGGFGVGSALRLASFAGQMYMGGMMGGRGLSLGMMNPMAAMSGVGGLGPMGGGFFDPRAMAMSSMSASLGAGMMAGMGGMPGMVDPSEAGLRDTMSEALTNGAKSAMDQLGKKK